MQVFHVGRRRSLGIAGFVALCLVVAAVGEAAPAIADSAPLSPDAGAPWAAPLHDSPFELLASQIASHIAGRAVSVHCESPADWSSFAASNGLDPNAEDGYVGSTWDQATGALDGVSTVAELDGTNICLPLSEFAEASTKPNKCIPEATVSASKPARTKPAGASPAGARVRRSIRALAATLASAYPAQLEPCYLGDGKEARTLSASYWVTYERVAWAMLTLAHESVHLSGVVGGTLANGTPVGDPQAEAKANCFGMQWVPYVAQELGDTPDDGLAIAQFIWTYMYPAIQGSDHPEYWSADCAPGGALDIRPAGATAWP